MLRARFSLALEGIAAPPLTWATEAKWNGTELNRHSINATGLQPVILATWLVPFQMEVEGIEPTRSHYSLQIYSLTDLP